MAKVSPKAVLGDANDDFAVEEIPLYAASGEGEHHYLLVQKRNCTTPLLIKALAACCHISERDIGYAGRKDRHALTRQWISLHGGNLSGLDNLSASLPDDAEVKILQQTRHGNKLKIGHLRGNRFRLQLENVEDFNELSVHIASTLAAGIPNFYGHQRYGRDGFNLRLAQELAAKSKKLRRNDKRLRYASDAAQAAIFDAVIAGRLAENRLHQATVGDVCMLPNGACFVVEAQEVDEVNKRLSQQEISCTGPLPGTHCKAAQDPAADDELRWSQHLGIHWQEFAKGGTLCSRGGRRPATVQFLEAPLLSGNESDSDKATLTFALGAGNYASNVAQAFDIQWQRPNGG